MVRHILFLLVLLVSVSVQAAPTKCDLGRCYKGLTEAQQQALQNGETVFTHERDPSSGFEKLYAHKILKLEKSVAELSLPELALAVFTRFELHEAETGVVNYAKVLDQAPGRVSVEYEFKASKVVGGLKAKAAKASKYVLFEYTKYDPESGRYWVEWEIDPARTAKFYTGFSLLGHPEEPGNIHGFFVAEPTANLNEIVVSYGNFIELKNKAGRMMAGTIASSARDIHVETFSRFATWIDRVAKDPKAAEEYLANFRKLQPKCEIYLGATR